MEGFGSLRQFVQVPFLQRLRERIEQAPDIPLVEGIMPRFPPFAQDRRNEPIAAHPHIAGTDHQIMRFLILNGSILVCAETFILIVPFRHEETDGPLHQLRQITIDEPGMLPSEFDLAMEREVVTDED